MDQREPVEWKIKDVVILALVLAAFFAFAFFSGQSEIGVEPDSASESVVDERPEEESDRRDEPDLPADLAQHLFTRRVDEPDDPGDGDLDALLAAAGVYDELAEGSSHLAVFDCATRAIMEGVDACLDEHDPPHTPP